MPGGKNQRKQAEKKQQQQPQQQSKAKEEKPKAAPKKAPQPAQSQPAPSKSASASSGVSYGVYVKRLNFPGRDKDAIRSIFEPCGGKITDVRVRGQKYIIVWFDKEDAQKKAIAMSGTTQRGCTIRVLKAKIQPKTGGTAGAKTAYVTNLPGGCTAGQLSNHFKACGKLVKTRVYAGHYGFLYFRDHKAIAAAKKVAADTPFFGNTLNVRASTRTQKSDRQKDSKRRYEALLLRIGRQRKWTTFK